MGSSPRVRGAADIPTIHGVLIGIIPARAGSSCASAPRPMRRWDHPRACGEQEDGAGICRLQLGSSPRVRGAVVCGASGGTLEGIIPARAGSSGGIAPRPLGLGDHPRACGEQAPSLKLIDVIPGSSPRVRGAASTADVLSAAAGIIPARAGSSGCARGPSAAPRDHPRACGEQEVGGYVRDLFPGSSPRVRGAAASASAV